MTRSSKSTGQGLCVDRECWMVDARGSRPGPEQQPTGQQVQQHGEPNVGHRCAIAPFVWPSRS